MSSVLLSTSFRMSCVLRGLGSRLRQDTLHVRPAAHHQTPAAELQIFAGNAPKGGTKLPHSQVRFFGHPTESAMIRIIYMYISNLSNAHATAHQGRASPRAALIDFYPQDFPWQVGLLSPPSFPTLAKALLRPSWLVRCFNRVMFCQKFKILCISMGCVFFYFI